MDLIELIFDRLDALSTDLSTSSRNGFGADDFSAGQDSGLETAADRVDDELSALRRLVAMYNSAHLGAWLREFAELEAAVVTPHEHARWARYCDLTAVLRGYLLIDVSPGTGRYVLTRRGEALLADTA